MVDRFIPDYVYEECLPVARKSNNGWLVSYVDYAYLEDRVAELEKGAAMWSYVKSIHTDGWVSEVEDRASREP